jgi:hypothetical protein
MIKIIPLSIVIASIVVPMYLSGRSRPKEAVRTLWITMALLALVWTLLCAKVYPAFVPPE